MSNLCITDGSMSDLCIIVSNQNMCDGIERLGMCGQLLMFVYARVAFKKPRS